MSPEQLSDKTVDDRSDQFSFGTILYEMLAGKRPFDKPSAVQTVVAIMEAEPDPLPRHRRVPDALTAVVMRLLAKSPRDRFPSTREVAERLKAARSEPLTTSTGRVPFRSQETELPEFLNAPSDEGESRSAPFFVGRDSAYAWLSERLQKALTGAGQLVFVTGEPGSGKTSLFNEFIRRAQEEHDEFVTAVGYCNAQTGAGDPYLPFREIAHLLTGDVEARREARAMGRGEALRLWHLLPHALATLLKVGPDLVETFVGASGLLERAEQYGCRTADREQLQELAAQKATQEVATGVQQSLLLEQCAKFLQGLSRRRPLLLVFEDLHWADAGTIALLCHLCQQLDGFPVMIAGSYRPEHLNREGDDRHPLEAARHELRRKYGEFELRIGEARGREFVHALIDAQPIASTMPFARRSTVRRKATRYSRWSFFATCVSATSSSKTRTAATSCRRRSTGTSCPSAPRRSSPTVSAASPKSFKES